MGPIYIFLGAEFDKMRNGNPGSGSTLPGSQQQPTGGQPTQTATAPRRDPFGSAPFAVQEKNY